jgi:ABC-2 type transport system ATP-binding protein
VSREQTSTGPIITVEGLTKRYGPLVAVDGISFAVYPGETFGMLGPNGAGKTTTLEMIEGLRRPDAGRMTFMGLDAVRERGKVQQRIGVQLQSQALWPELTVEETLKVFQSLFNKRTPIEHLLERFSLADKRRERVKGLSGGQRQRLSIATALVNDPELVFLDEPTTGLDPQARHGFWDLIREMQREGKTVVVTTHYMEEAEALCDRVAIMDHGRIMALDTPRRLVQAHVSESTIEFGHSEGTDHTSLSSLPGVSDIRSEDGTLLLFTNDVSATLNALVRMADEKEMPIRSLNVRSATLEDVFITLTGRRLRD